MLSHLALMVQRAYISHSFPHVAMPALRKSIRAPPPNRSSTTPYGSPTGTPSDSTGGKQRQSLMTEWTEPLPQTLAPSFEEHGFARHGVLETMAPLGVPPSAKVKQRTRAMGEAAARNSALGKGSTVFGDDVGSTPEVTPAPELERDDSERQEEYEMQVDFVMQDEEDDDYEPTKKPKKGKGSKTPVRGKTPVQGKTPVPGKTPVKVGNSKTASISASPAVQAVQPPSPVDAVTTQRLHTAVNDAIIRANRDQNRQLGVAIREMFEESQEDTVLAAVIDAIIHQNFTEKQMDIFRKFIKHSRKRQKNTAKLKRMEDDYPGRRAADIYGGLNMSQRASPRASSELVPEDSVSAVHDIAYQDNHASSTSRPMHAATNDAHRALQASIEQNPESNSLHPFNAAPQIPTALSSGESTPRMPSKSPRKRPSTNGRVAPDSAMDIDGGTATPAGGSDSELSDVNEEIVQKGPPEPVKANGKTLNAAAAAAEKKAKSAAFARAAKKLKPNAGKLFGKHAYKQLHQPTPEQLAEDDRAHEERKEMVKQQNMHRLDLNDFPTSDVRFDDEINDTESLTESQIAVGPPVDSDQPRRAGRVPQQGTKRLREEDTARFSSPMVESAAGTRPSTPAVAPTIKKLKLNHGQAARTKRS